MLAKQTKREIACVSSCILLFLTGCSNTNSSHITSPAPPKPVKKVISMRPHSQHFVSRERTIIRLPELWGRSKKQIQHALRRYKLTERDPVPQDYPDPMSAGGEIWTYHFKGETEILVAFNSRGYATYVAIVNESGLGLTLSQWRDAFGRYGLPDCGEPAKTAPEAYYWGPPHNRTGGFEIEVIANEKGQIWQVQARSPEDFFPG